MRHKTRSRCYQRQLGVSSVATATAAAASAATPSSSAGTNASRRLLWSGTPVEGVCGGGNVAAGESGGDLASGNASCSATRPPPRPACTQNPHTLPFAPHPPPHVYAICTREGVPQSMCARVGVGRDRNEVRGFECERERNATWTWNIRRRRLLQVQVW